MNNVVRAGLLVWVAACGEVQALPDGGSDDGGDGGGAIDAPAVDAMASPLPRKALTATLDGLELDLAGTVALGTSRVSVGMNVTNQPSMRDGLIISIDSEQSVRAWRFDGGLNDQLLAVGSQGVELAAVGLTRSYRGPLTEDQGLGIFGNLADGTFTVRNYFVDAADENLQFRAVAPHGSGWVLGGTHLAGARAFVGVADIGGNVRNAVTLVPAEGATEIRVRKLISVSGNIFVIGRGVRGALPFGFVLQLDGADLSVRQARVFDAPAGIEIFDGAIVGTTMRLVGATPTAGISLALDETGATSEFVEWPMHRLTSIMPSAAGPFVSGSVGPAPFAGILTPSTLRGVTLPGITPTVLTPDRLVATPAAAAYYGLKAGQLTEVPLNDTPVGACNDAALGAPTSTAPTSTPATVGIPAVEIRPLGLRSTVQPTVLSAANVAFTDACTF